MKDTIIPILLTPLVHITHKHWKLKITTSKTKNPKTVIVNRNILNCFSKCEVLFMASPAMHTVHYDQLFFDDFDDNRP